ncbi:MAG TPA: helix-hairpin-helix domain-containing protein, partial [Longimicrobium sp.]|nr:helix-hairpin-helix domain-containing protein [Longimicrobium sp.]
MAKSNEGGGKRGGKLDLNTASREELMALEGIGERTVERLLQAREEMGGIQSLDALVEIEGIGETTVRLLGQHVQAGGGGKGGGGGRSKGGEQDGMARQARELFLHQLSDIYDGEQRVAQML